MYRDSFRIIHSNRRTCTHCREYICAFTSNYAGRGNPVRRHAASSREDQRTRRHSVLLHSLVVSDAYNATFGVATPKRRESYGPPARLWRNFGRVPANTPTRRQTKFSRLFGHSHRIEISFRHANFKKSLTENYRNRVQIAGCFRNVFYESGIKIQMERFMILL